MTNEQLVSEIRNGYSVTDYMQLLYENNLPLIRKFIKPYAAYAEFEDILQESYFGLWEAVQHYETSENVLFMTYARYWVIQSVQRHLEKCGFAVRIPSSVRAKMTKYKRITRQLEQEQGRTPTDAEIAAIMRITVEEVQEIKICMQGVVSTDTPISDDSSLTLSDTLTADFSLENDIVDKIYHEHSENELWRIVAHYTAEKENKVIKEYFINQKSMSQIARESGLSLDRIRQIKESGLRRLRRGKAKRELLKKFDIADTMLYMGGLNDYKEKGCSIVERIVIKRIEAEERYQRHLAGIDEMHRKRLLKD